jgi:hypothetical protein
MKQPTPITLEFSRVYIIARETSARLERLTARVREGKALQDAQEFVAYLTWSGILKLLEHAEQPDALPVNGALIKYKAQQLEQLVHDQFRNPQVESSVELTELEKLNRKLDLIAGQVAKL